MNVQHAPAFRVALLFVAGILFGTTASGDLEGYIAAAVVVAICAILFSLMRTHQASALSSILAAIVCLQLGILQCNFDRNKINGIPDSLLTGRSLAVGSIVEPPTTVGSRTRWTLELERVKNGKGEFRLTDCVAVTLVRKRNDTIDVRPEYGMRIVLMGELSRPFDERNPGEFSIRRYYEANGITFEMFVRGTGGVLVLDSLGGSWIMKRCVVPVRRFILSEIDRTVGGEEGEFLKGLLIGERSGIPVTTRQAFVNAGVAHVLAVSGSNVAFVAAVLVFIFGFVRLPRLVSTAGIVGGVIFYMMLTGNQPSVARATIMALVVLLGKAMQRKTNAYNAIGVSALIILAIDSRQLFDVGFQLSYGAVLSIVCLYPRMNLWILRIEPRTGVRRATLWMLRLCAVSLAATLGTLPLTASAFGRVSVIGILANLVVIPATGLSVILGCIASAVGAVHPWASWICAGTNTIVLRWTLAVTELAGGAPFAYVDTLRFHSVDALPYFAVLATVLSFPNGHTTRRLTIVSLLALNVAILFPRQETSIRHPGYLRVNAIDVGEGDAILLECPGGENILVDTGPATPSYDAGERFVVPYLKRRGISTVQLLLLTHPHGDHMGGAAFVLRHVGVCSVAESGQSESTGLYGRFLAAVTEAGAGRRLIRAGEKLEIASGVRIYVLSPDGPTDSSSNAPNLNNTSVVLRVVYGMVSFLLAGDAEREIEERLGERYGDFLHSTWLKAGHHGSSTSSTEGFITCVGPESVLLSVGRNNTFRHPSTSVVRRYQDHGIPIFRTDEEGAIVIETDGNHWSRIQWR